MKQTTYIQHWLLSITGMLLLAGISAVMQLAYSVDRMWQLSLILYSLTGLIFATVFAWFQRRLHLLWKDTAIAVGILVGSLILLQYLSWHNGIDWYAVSEGRYHLSVYEQLLTADAVHWSCFSLPFIYSIFIYMLRRFPDRNQH